MSRRLRRSLLLFLILTLSIQVHAFARESVPVMTGYGDDYVLFENGEGYLLDAAGDRTDIDVPRGADVLFCTVLEDTLYWEDSEGSVYRSGNLKESELLFRNMPSLAGIVLRDEAEQFVFSDGTLIYVDGSEEKTALPVESVLVGAETNDYMTVLAEENGTLWIRKGSEDFSRVLYDELYGVRVRLTDMAVWENTVYICGEREDGSPFLAGSVMGGVWLERATANSADTGTAEASAGIPLCMTAAEELGALVLGCSDGTVSVLPSCVKCSASYPVADTAVTDIAAAGPSVGYIANGEVNIIPLNEIPQNENPEQDCPTGC